MDDTSLLEQTLGETVTWNKARINFPGARSFIRTRFKEHPLEA